MILIKSCIDTDSDFITNLNTGSAGPRGDSLLPSASARSSPWPRLGSASLPTRALRLCTSSGGRRVALCSAFYLSRPPHPRPWSGEVQMLPLWSPVPMRRDIYHCYCCFTFINWGWCVCGGQRAAWRSGTLTFHLVVSWVKLGWQSRPVLSFANHASIKQKDATLRYSPENSQVTMKYKAMSTPAYTHAHSAEQRKPSSLKREKCEKFYRSGSLLRINSCWTWS